MQYIVIFNELLDYRAYVSHTLCKHRLFLGLSSPENARLRLRDAAVWPLVVDEAVKLWGCSGTLFGVVSRSLDQVCETGKQVVSEMRTLHARLESGDDSAFQVFVTQAESFSTVLTDVYRVLDEQTPDFSEEAASVYLAGRTSGDFLERVNENVRTKMIPFVESLAADMDDGAEPYRHFWEVSSDAYYLTRCAAVAAAAADEAAHAMAPIRAVQKKLRGIERVVSCWSPNTAVAERPQFVARSLQAEGYGSLRAFCAELASLGVNR